jgi:hypothetical protein
LCWAWHRLQAARALAARPRGSTAGATPQPPRPLLPPTPPSARAAGAWWRAPSPLRAPAAARRPSRPPAARVARAQAHIGCGAGGAAGNGVPTGRAGGGAGRGRGARSLVLRRRGGPPTPTPSSSALPPPPPGRAWHAAGHGQARARRGVGGRRGQAAPAGAQGFLRPHPRRQHGGAAPGKGQAGRPKIRLLARRDSCHPSSGAMLIFSVYVTCGGKGEGKVGAVSAAVHTNVNRG